MQEIESELAKENLSAGIRSDPVAHIATETESMEVRSQQRVSERTAAMKKVSKSTMSALSGGSDSMAASSLRSGGLDLEKENQNLSEKLKKRRLQVAEASKRSRLRRKQEYDDVKQQNDALVQEIYRLKKTLDKLDQTEKDQETHTNELQNLQKYSFNATNLKTEGACLCEPNGNGEGLLESGTVQQQFQLPMQLMNLNSLQMSALCFQGQNVSTFAPNLYKLGSPFDNLQCFPSMVNMAPNLFPNQVPLFMQQQGISNSFPTFNESNLNINKNNSGTSKERASTTSTMSEPTSNASSAHSFSKRIAVLPAVKGSEKDDETKTSKFDVGTIGVASERITSFLQARIDAFMKTLSEDYLRYNSNKDEAKSRENIEHVLQRMHAKVQVKVV